MQQQLRCHDVIRILSKTHKQNWEYPASAAIILFGLGNVMIRYEYEPFMRSLSILPNTKELYWNTQQISEQQALQVIDYVKQFRNKRK